MVVENSTLAPFTTVKYTTKDGENCTATKNNGIVTVTSDKNGVRQMPVEEFMKNLAENLPQTNLEKSLAKDTVSFSGNNAEKKSSKSLIGWLSALGLAAIGAGVYFATRGKSGDTIVETARNAIKKGTDSAKKAVEDVVDKINPQKAEEVASNATPAPVAHTPTAATETPKAKPTAKKQPSAKHTTKTKAEPKAESEAKPKTKPTKTETEPKVETKIEELPAETNTKTATLESESDDILKQAQKRVEEERKQIQDIEDNNIIAAAIIADDMARAGGKKATQAVEELLPKGEKLMDDAADVVHRPSADVVQPSADVAIKPSAFEEPYKPYDDLAPKSTTHSPHSSLDDEFSPHKFENLTPESTYDDLTHKPHSSLDDEFSPHKFENLTPESTYDDLTHKPYSSLDDEFSPYKFEDPYTSHYDDFNSNSFMDDVSDFADDGFGF